MRSIYCWLVLFTLLAISGNVKAQQQYKGTMVTKLGAEQTGMINVNLDGPNKELIEIVSTEQSKTKGRGKRTKSVATTTMSLNVAFIHHIIINDSVYYFRDIKYDYNEKYYVNVCVRLTGGTLDCGIFQNGLSTGNDNLSIKLPLSEFSKLVSVDFDYYRSTTGWHMMGFGGCEPLRAKMSAKENGYSWDDATPREERIAMWRNWIDEFNKCSK